MKSTLSSREARQTMGMKPTFCLQTLWRPCVPYRKIFEDNPRSCLIPFFNGRAYSAITKTALRTPIQTMACPVPPPRKTLLMWNSGSRVVKGVHLSNCSSVTLSRVRAAHITGASVWTLWGLAKMPSRDGKDEICWSFFLRGQELVPFIQSFLTSSRWCPERRLGVSSPCVDESVKPLV